MLASGNWTGSKAPEIAEGIWVNSKPLRLQDLRGQLVLVDFWEYSCINCLRTLPYLKEWYRRYHALGLEIIGVHAPEFEFGKKKENVESAMRKLGITWPVILDNDFNTWRAYENSVWPREILVDQTGRVVHDQSGEGGYRLTEELIQKILKKQHPQHEFPPLMEFVRETDKPHRVCYRTSPELYAGYERGLLGNSEGFRRGHVVDYSDPGKALVEDQLYVRGRWKNNLQSLQYAGDKYSINSWIGLQYHAKGVFAVIRPEDERGFKVMVTQDGKPLGQDSAGEDIRAEDGKSFFVVEEARMYRLIDNNKFGVHTLKLYPDSNSFGFYTFTFESACEN